MIMTTTDFVARLCRAAHSDTAYLWGTFGNRLTADLIDQKAKQYPTRYSAARQQTLKALAAAAASADQTVWAFDCVGLLKGLLWGWTGDTDKSYGGGAYASNDVPDASASGLFGGCKDISADFSRVLPGEFLYMPGHIGVYIGNGEAVEATLAGSFDGVVIRPLAGRGWQKHGKYPRLDYDAAETDQPAGTDQPTEPEKPDESEEDNMKYFIHVQSVGLRVRSALTFHQGKPTGKEIAFCPKGGDMELLGFIPGIQPDGYQWLRTRYNGVAGVSQYDSKCYYIYAKEQ